MKTTGIVRQIDELGRIVIPVEFRKVNGWSAGTSVEFSTTDEGELVVRKYSPLDSGSLDRLAADLERIQGMDNGGEANTHLARALSHIKAARESVQSHAG